MKIGGVIALVALVMLLMMSDGDPKPPSSNKVPVHAATHAAAPVRRLRTSNYRAPGVVSAGLAHQLAMSHPAPSVVDVDETPELPPLWPLSDRAAFNNFVRYGVVPKNVVPLRLNEHGQPVAEVTVDEKTYDVLVDTGSSHLLLEECGTRTCAEASIGDRIDLVYGHQRNPDSLMTRLGSFKLGDVAVENGRVVLHSEDAGQNILGLAPLVGKRAGESFVDSMFAGKDTAFFTIRLPTSRESADGFLDFSVDAVPEHAVSLPLVSQDERKAKGVQDFTSAHYLLDGGDRMVVLDTGTQHAVNLRPGRKVGAFTVPRTAFSNPWLLEDHQLGLLGQDALTGFDLTFELGRVDGHLVPKGLHAVPWTQPTVEVDSPTGQRGWTVQAPSAVLATDQSR